MLYVQPRATVAFVGVATLNLALPAPPVVKFHNTSAPARLHLPVTRIDPFFRSETSELSTATGIIMK